MAHRAYKMRLKKEKVKDYKEIHSKEHIWPEIVSCLTESGMERMIILQDGQELMLFEEAEDLDRSYQIQMKDSATRKWEKMIEGWMEKYPVMEGLNIEDLVFEEVEIVFYLKNGELKH